MCYERDRGRALTNSPYTHSLPIYEWWVGNATDFNCLNVKCNNYAKKKTFQLKHLLLKTSNIYSNNSKLLLVFIASPTGITWRNRM